MCYAHAVRSKYPRARVVKIDAEKARSMPGVLGVLTAEDVPVNQVGHLIEDWDVMIAEGDITRCVGDVICLVVAEDTKTLEKAQKAVKVTYEVLEPVRDIAEAKAEGLSLIHISRPRRPRVRRRDRRPRVPRRGKEGRGPLFARHRCRHRRRGQHRHGRRPRG